jgi:hypothetical protein
MDLKNKLKNIPPVYYFNYDKNGHLNDHMDRNLSNLKVEKYKRIPISKYNPENVSEWKGLIMDLPKYKLPITTAAYSITVLEFLKDWYNNTQEERLIVSKDTIDFGLEGYWNFDWDYLTTKIPYDWDCVLLGFENVNYIPFYLHQIMPAHTFSIAMLNRRYVKKLLRLHCFGEKYKIANYIANKNFNFNSGTVDYFIGHCGKTYCLPMFPNDTDFFDSKSKRYLIVKACRLAYYDWWRNDLKKYEFPEIFTYGKPNDISMIKKPLNYIRT